MLKITRAHQTVVDFLSRHIQDFENKKFLLAVSGGIDSMVLFKLFFDLKLKIEVIHFNHQLRANESDDDQSFVKQKCDDFKVKCHIIPLSFPDTTHSIQQLAREKRYQHLEEVCFQNECDYIVTAHHANDLAETMTNHWIRGAGMAGLKGIPKVNDKIIRPLLSIGKCDIIDFAKKQKLSWREDSSNAQNKYTRNKIRNLLIPSIEELNPNYVNTLRLESERYDDLNEFLKNEIIQFKNKWVKEWYDLKLWPVQTLSKPGGLNILAGFLRDFNFSFEQSLAIYTAAKSQETRHYKNGTYTIHLNSGYYWLELNIKQKESIKYKFDESELLSPFGKLSISSIETLDNICIPADWANELSVRFWKPGDFFRPKGMRGRKQKLQDYFTNTKVHWPLRSRIPLLLYKDEIIWISKHRQSEFPLERVNEWIYVNLDSEPFPFSNHC